MFRRYKILSFHFCHFTRISGTKSKAERGGMLRGKDEYDFG
jgi:hypothetical protein